MSITTYGELQTAVANWLHRVGESGLSDRSAEWIALAEDRINLELRIRPMETESDLTVSSQSVGLPTGHVGTRRIYLSGSPNKPLDYMTPDIFWQTFLATQTGTPKAFTIEGDSLKFGPAPDDSYTGKHLYYKAFTSLSGSSDTNWLLSNARGLLLYGALLEASHYFMKPVAETITWAQRFDDLIEQVKDSDRMDRFPKGVAMRSDGVSIS